MALLMGPGCTVQKRVVKQNPWDQMFRDSEWYDDSASGSGGANSSGRSNRGYAVQLGQYGAAEAFRKVPELIRSARTQGGLADLWYLSTGGQTTVYAGRFRDDESKDAKATLRRARKAQINGDTPFEDAKLVALTSNRGEVLDPHDLRSLKGKGLYTLQIGYYDTGYGPDYRRAAENAAKALREQGHEAFYYHGMHHSSITLYAWTYGEAFTRQGSVDAYSNAVRAIREKHPHNVPNGKPFTDADDPAYVNSQRSSLVRID